MMTANRTRAAYARSLALVLGLVLLSTTALAFDRPATEDATVEIPTRVVEVTSGQEFDRFLVEQGYDEEVVQALSLAARDRAIRAAYGTGDLRAIKDIEAQLAPEEIKRALAGVDRPDGGLATRGSGAHIAWFEALPGNGAFSRFKVYGSWHAYFEMTSGNRTPTYSSYCSNWTWGCTNTDSVSGHPIVTWRFHFLHATQWDFHWAAATI